MNKKANSPLSSLGELILAAIILFIILVPTVYIINWYSGGDECDNKAVIKDLYNIIQDLESKKVQSADITNVFNQECFITTFSQDQSYNQIIPPKNEFKSPFICLCRIYKDECAVDNQQSCVELKTFTQINDVQFNTEGFDTYLSLNFKREDKKLIISQDSADLQSTPTTNPPIIKTDKCGVASIGSSEMKALLDTIAWAEGANYNVMFGYNKNKPNERIFSDFSAHPVYTGEMPPKGFPFSGGTSTAAGRYQFLKVTYDDEKKLGFFSTGFTPEEQDKAAIDLITRKRKLSEDEIKKAIEIKNFRPVWDKLMYEWASIPKSGGGSYHSGQGAKSEEQLTELYYQCYNLLNENKPQPLLT